MNLGGAPEGNTNARGAKMWRAALKRALTHATKKNASEGLFKMAQKVVEAALNGEQWAIREIADRIDGKATQAVEATGANGGPIAYRELSDKEAAQMLWSLMQSAANEADARDDAESA